MPRPLRVLSLGHSYVVGVNRRLAWAVQQAAGPRGRVTVAAPKYFRGRGDIRPLTLDAGPDEPVPVVPLNAYATGRVHVFSYGRRLRSLLAEPWDIVHCWEEPYIVAGFQVARWVRPETKFVFRTAQSLDKRYPPPFNLLERYSVGRANGWICSGRTVEANLLGRRGYAAKPHAVIPLGVDLRTFRPDPAAQTAVRRELGWEKEGPPVVGFLGRFVPEKGWPMLTRVLDSLQTRWRALFVGGGPDEPALRRWAARHPAGVRVLSVPHDRVQAYLAAMDVLAVPSLTTRSWREQFGRVLIEAFACGVPVVGSDSGEIPTVLGDSGVVVPEGDEAAWADALATILESPTSRKDLSARGRDRAPEFDWEQVGRRHLEFFEQVRGESTRDQHFPCTHPTSTAS